VGLSQFAKKIVIPSSVTYNGKTYSVTSINNYAFYGCSFLTSIEIPNSVKSIGDYAFEECTGLTSIEMNSVTSIGNSAFFNCSGLTSIEMNSMTSIGNGAFMNCSRLTSVVIPSSVTFIGNNAFCSIGLQSVTFLGNIPSTSSNIFGHNMVASLTLASNVKSIGTSINVKKAIWLTNTPPTGYEKVNAEVNYVANNQYTSLKNVKVYPFISSLFEVDGVKYVPVSPSEKTCDAIDGNYDVSTSSIVIGKDVTYKGVSMIVKQICPYALYGNKSINTVNLSIDGKIGEYAFSECSNMNNVSIEIGGIIGNYAFYKSGLQKLKVIKSGDIGEYAFGSITSSFSAQINSNGVIKANAFNGCTSMTSAFLTSITSIGNNAFYGCSRLGSITIPNSVKQLGSQMFSGCTGLQIASIGNGVASIPDYAFKGCSSLTDVKIGSNVQTIGTYAFSGCSKLPNIEIPASVTAVNDYAFDGCSKLTKVIMNDGKSALKLGANGSNPLFASCPLDTVYIGRNISYDATSSRGYSPFYRNTSLRAVEITDKETEISENEFYGCSKLKNVRIGDGVTTIGKWAFSGCASLNYFAFGRKVKTIGNESFSDCTNVTHLISRAPVPPTCGSQALDDINKWSCKLTVPQGCTAAYQAAPQWKEFFFMEEGEAIITPDEKVTVEMPASGYATFYNSAGSYALPTGLVAKVVTGVAGNKITYETIADGSKNKCIVPAGVPVMLEYKSRQGGTYTLTLSEQEDEYSGSNLLEGSDVAMTVAPADDECAYKLSYGPSNSEYNKVFGWYWGAANGAGFEIGAHKAWLKVKKASAARSYAVDGEALGIENHTFDVAKPQVCYDLQGRLVEQPTRKGLYIINGKKMIRK
jgi:hypothetical protein